ncbi:MAG: hypothetical protein WAN46_16745 [Gammaproteobacteria bacterium]|jgi:hypothetical protein
MDKFDEYKFFAQSTQHLSERRHAATQIFLSVNTAIFILVAFRLKIADLEGWILVISTLPLFLVGVLVCLVWHQLIKHYKSLIGWRYQQLMEMERAMPESHQMYVKEWQAFFRPQDEREKFGFSWLEVWLPRLFIVLYVFSSIGLLFV